MAWGIVDVFIYALIVFDSLFRGIKKLKGYSLWLGYRWRGMGLFIVVYLYSKYTIKYANCECL